MSAKAIWIPAFLTAGLLIKVLKVSSSCSSKIIYIIQGHVKHIQIHSPRCPKTVDSPNTVLQKITGGIFSTQFVQCNDDGAGDKCMFLSVFTYSSNPLTQICEIVQLTRWAHRKFPQNFLPSSRHKKHGECLLLLLACKFRRSQHVNLKLWLFHVIGVKRYREAESVHWGSETV